LSVQLSAHHDRDEEFLWLEQTESMAALLASGRTHAAAALCRSACALAERFASNDPRRAASLNNLAVAHRLAGDRDEAEAGYRRAFAAWEHSTVWVQAMRPTPRARSSLFHLRLETRHRATYQRLARSQYQESLRAGRAVTLNNLAELLHAGGLNDDAEHLYRRAAADRRKLADGDDIANHVVTANIAALQGGANGGALAAHASRPFTALAAHKGWIIDRPPVLTDEGRLMAAVLCAVAVRHADIASDVNA